MADKKTYIDRETIQAIAQELNKLNTQQQPTPSAHAQTGANCGKNQTKPNANSNKKTAWGDVVKLCSIIGLFIFWGSVFIVLWCKVLAYI